MQRLGAADELRDVDTLQGAFAEIGGAFAIEAAHQRIQGVAARGGVDLERAGAGEFVKPGECAEKARHGDAVTLHGEGDRGNGGRRINRHAAFPIAAECLELRQVGCKPAIHQLRREHGIGQLHAAERDLRGGQLEVCVGG